MELFYIVDIFSSCVVLFIYLFFFFLVVVYYFCLLVGCFVCLLFVFHSVNYFRQVAL